MLPARVLAAAAPESAVGVGAELAECSSRGGDLGVAGLASALLRGISAYWVGDGRDGFSALPHLLVVA